MEEKDMPRMEEGKTKETMTPMERLRTAWGAEEAGERLEPLPEDAPKTRARRDRRKARRAADWPAEKRARRKAATQGHTIHPEAPDEERASVNAWRMGICGADVACPSFGNETVHEFEDFMRDLRADLKPRGRMEEFLVEQIGIAHWRLRRALRAERGYLLHFSDSNAYRTWEMRSRTVSMPVEGDSGWDDLRRMPHPEHATRVERYRYLAERTLLRCLWRLEQSQRSRRWAEREKKRRQRAKLKRFLARKPGDNSPLPASGNSSHETVN